jgi:hypothetical protein
MARPVREDELAEEAIPGYRNYLVYCDESGIDGQVYYGFGSLWMPWERRGDFTGLLKSLREKHRYRGEIKWNAVSRAVLPFYSDLIEAFFRRTWLMFHCIVVRKGYVDLKFHKDFDQARRKHFAMLINSKVKFFAAGAKDKAYHVRVDPLPSRYEKADEAALKIVAATLKKELGLVPLKTLITVDSKTSHGVQVADFLLGAVMSGSQGKATSEHKLRLSRELAEHLGWKNLKADTHLKEWKFNIWYFFDPKAGAPREVQSRTVKLKFPMPPLKRK